MRSNVPFLSLMGANSASGLGMPPPDYLSSTGAEFYIDYDANVMYTPDGNGGWSVDPNATSLLQQTVSISPTAVQQADASSGSSLSNFFASLTNVIPALIQGKAQSDLMKINLQRAQQGLPPINASAYTPGVQVGLSQPTQQLVMYLGIGAIAVLGFSALAGSRSSGRRR